MKAIFNCCVFLTVIIFSIPTLAKVDRQKVQAQISERCGNRPAGIAQKELEFGWGDPSKKIQNEVAAEATLHAWEAFVQTFPAIRLKTYMEKKDEIEQNLTKFLKHPPQLFSDLQKKPTRIYYVTACIDPDEKYLSTKLGPTQAPSGQGSKFVTLFVAREAETAQTFSATTDATGSKTEKSESMRLDKERAQASAGSAISASSTKSGSSSQYNFTSSSSETRRSDQIKYKIISSQAVDGAMSKSLTDAGYESLLYDTVAAYCDGVPLSEYEKIFRTKENLTGKQRKDAVIAAKACGGEFFAEGTMTADAKRIDNQDGMVEVTVRVQGEIYNIKKVLPLRISTIPPQQFTGRGLSQDEARTNALILAGKAAGEMITEALQAKGVK